MKTFLITISILIFALTINAQEKCELNLSQSPTLQKLKLGMTPSEASNVLGIKVKVKPEGQRSFFRNYIKKKAKGNLTGIRALFVRFYDGKIYQIEIFYEKDYRWQTLESMIDDYSASNNFPKEFWLNEYGYAKANCKGFSIDADYILNPHIQISEDAIAELVESKQEKLF
jgi:hypothetical protein